MLGIIVSFVLGVIFGTITMSMCVLAGRADRLDEKRKENYNGSIQS